MHILREEGKEIKFSELTAESYQVLAPYFKGLKYVYADYSFGYLFMYNEYVHYEYLIEDEILYVMYEKNDKLCWFAPMCIREEDFFKGVDRIVSISRGLSKKIVLLSVPDRFIGLICEKYEAEVDRSEKWADYVYDIIPFSELKGKKYHAKRNYISRFNRLYGNCEFKPITLDKIDQIKEFFEKFKEGEEKGTKIFDMELKATTLVLENFEKYKPEGYYISLNGEILGFTIGEVSGNTLIVHIEKCNKEFVGVYETLTNLFVRKMLEKYPALEYVNREDDAGDDGLKKSKLSYHPVMIASKNHITLSLT